MENRKDDNKNLLRDKGVEDQRNAKERLYDKIPISLKSLDIIIGVLVTILVVMMLYFVIRRFI